MRKVRTVLDKNIVKSPTCKCGMKECDCNKAIKKKLVGGCCCVGGCGCTKNI